MQKAFYIIILQLSVLIGSPNIHPMVKSMLIPGWGEAELGHQKKSRFFFHSETILVTSCLSESVSYTHLTLPKSDLV